MIIVQLNCNQIFFNFQKSPFIVDQGEKEQRTDRVEQIDRLGDRLEVGR